MGIKSGLNRKVIACCLVTLLAATFAEAAPVPLQQTMSTESQQSASQVQDKAHDSRSDSIGGGVKAATTENPPATEPNSNGGPDQSTNQDAQSTRSQPVAEQQQDGVTQPVGTAAAPRETTTGVAASKPAGAVIAPSKQRRARSFIIKLGVVAGACVAIGTVAALSHTSPSQPH